MANYFIFDTEEAANSRVASCTAGLGEAWGLVMSRLTDGKYYFKKPEDNYYNCTVCGGSCENTINAFSKDWRDGRPADLEAGEGLMEER